ncbi:putative rta1 domain protein [Phaeoacremonium minimum UCRPA7]|uniref:Putative rta1 domain protein n=1 Tax=Phaeoacremonium minimum (strain UCR-PA7) TaxID=1286976 RepID=R8BT12_PHAM7|nr:putative rta1 domain protein [Phaeoacremonium minimum UCRPA7]EOO02538.1 putative rta1 domain protein [Phaeoacremonium minimum UCRPA7]
MSENGKYVDGSLWFYAPNKGAPVFFTVAFGASGLCHIWQCIHYKCWKLMGVYTFCALLFTSGFILREIGTFNYDNLDIFLSSTVLIYAAPPLYELGNYQILGRILYYVPQLAPMHPGRVLTTFAAISGIVEALNANGAINASNSDLPMSRQNIGKALLKAALLIQIGVIFLFVLTAAYFQRQCIKNGIRNAKLNGALLTLYISSALITVRTIYRIVEYFSLAKLHFEEGMDPMSFSPIIRYEWFFYVFEAVLMICNQVLWNVRHPRRYLPSSTKVYLAKDGVTEILGPGYKDERNFLVTLFDPFDIYGLIKGRDKKTRFWENEAPTEDASRKENNRNGAAPESTV